MIFKEEQPTFVTDKVCQKSAAGTTYLLFQLRRYADELVHCVFSPNILNKEMTK